MLQQRGPLWRSFRVFGVLPRLCTAPFWVGMRTGEGGDPTGQSRGAFWGTSSGGWVVSPLRAESRVIDLWSWQTLIILEASLGGTTLCFQQAGGLGAPEAGNNVR